MEQELRDRLVRVEKLLEEVLSFVRPKKSRKEYQSKYYREKKTKELAELKRLRNPSKNNLYPDKRLCTEKVEDWAAAGFRFAAAAKHDSAYRFLGWLAYTWNVNTYQHRPITRSGGYYHVMIGFSGDKPMRIKWTENDLFGCGKRLTFTRVQRDQFADALWWHWGFGVLGKTVFEMQEDGRWAQLPKEFTEPLLLLMGGFGLLELRPGLIFDHNEPNCDTLSKAFRLAKPQLDRAWRACKNGLFIKEEPTP